MAGLRLLWVGKTQEDFVAAGVEYYRKRIAPFQPLEIVEVKAASHSGRDADRAIDKEGEALLKRLDPKDTVVLLDEQGKTPSTTQFATNLERWAERGGRSVSFVIGGAYGVSEEVRRRADSVLALSRLTFPHQLVRVIFLEQLYRALSLNAGRGYHHE